MQVTHSTSYYWKIFIFYVAHTLSKPLIDTVYFLMIGGIYNDKFIKEKSRIEFLDFIDAKNGVP